jgi:hypothetical protein
MLPSTATIASTKKELYNALQSRNITEINGDPLPANPKDIEFGVLLDESDEQSWTRLEEAITLNDDTKKGTPSRRGGSSINDTSLQTADIKNNQRIAFRFSKTGVTERGDKDELNLDDEDNAGWDVIQPALDDDGEPE